MCPHHKHAALHSSCRTRRHALAAVHPLTVASPTHPVCRQSRPGQLSHGSAASPPPPPLSPWPGDDWTAHVPQPPLAPSAPCPPVHKAALCRDAGLMLGSVLVFHPAVLSALFPPPGTPPCPTWASQLTLQPLLLPATAPRPLPPPHTPPPRPNTHTQVRGRVGPGHP